MDIRPESTQILTWNHSVSCPVTEETFTVTIFLHRSRLITHISSHICALPFSVLHLPQFHSLLSLCNSNVPIGTFKVLLSPSILTFTIDIYTGFSLPTSDLRLYSDLTARVTCAYQSLFQEITTSMAAGEPLNYLQALRNAPHQFEIMQREPSVQRRKQGKGETEGAKVILDTVLDEDRENAVQIALITDSLLSPTSPNRRFAFLLELTDLLSTSNLSLFPPFFLSFPESISVENIGKSITPKEALSYLSPMYRNSCDPCTSHLSSVWATHQISIWQFCCHLADLLITHILHHRIHTPKIHYFLVNSQNQLVAIQNNFTFFRGNYEENRKFVGKIGKIVLELHIRKIAHLNITKSNVVIDDLKRISIIDAYFSPFRIKSLQEAYKNASFCAEIDSISPEIAEIMLIKDEIISGNQSKIGHLFELYEKLDREAADCYSFGTFLYKTYQFSDQMQRFSLSEAELKLKRVILEDLRPCLDPGFESQRPRLADLIYRCWGEPRTRPTMQEIVRTLEGGLAEVS